MTEEENKVIEKFKEIRNRKGFAAQEDGRKSLTETETAIIYKWGFMKDADEGLEKLDIKSLLRTAYLIMKEQTEENSYKRLFKDVKMFNDSYQEVVNHFCSQYRKLYLKLDFGISD